MCQNVEVFVPSVLFDIFLFRCNKGVWLEKPCTSRRQGSLEDLCVIWPTGDVVLETRVLVSRRLEDKNESLSLGLGS